MKQAQVLVVDDEANMRRILELMLRQMGCQVHQAEDGQAAFEFLQHNDVDLVMTDLRMPRKTGLELLRDLRAQHDDVPVIVITAFGTVETAVDAMKYGACDYILRPFELDAVEASIKRAMTLHRVQRENRFLKQELGKQFAGFIGDSPAMRTVYELIQKVSATKTNVLIQGETGTGKELVARAIHQSSNRAEQLFVSINCAAIPADILESELFGHSKGAFTGAVKDRVGKFELADGGTLFLDEITEMDISLQAKLLRVLQEHRLERIGSNHTIDIDIRVIAATNRNPKQAIAEQRLREDVYYRLNVFSIDLPSLRDRQGDVPLLARHFIRQAATECGFPCAPLSEQAEHCLNAYHWPGNVRELENMMARAVVLSAGQPILAEHLPHEVALAPERAAAPEPVATSASSSLALTPKVEALERQLIQQALEASDNNKVKAARLLEISERSLWYKLKKYQCQT
ncbi:MAG: sigma-54 dependent transcriptional regulator [Methylococcales bacterium]|nr:sigma-54 dependent transcriptional regulator [Methylococcales bacterium]